jgi:hypothetical protein
MLAEYHDPRMFSSDKDKRDKGGNRREGGDDVKRDRGDSTRMPPPEPPAPPPPHRGPAQEEAGLNGGPIIDPD